MGERSVGLRLWDLNSIELKKVRFFRFILRSNRHWLIRMANARALSQI